MSIVAAYAVPHPPLIIPSVGRGEEKGIQATIDAYDEVARRIAELKPETIVVTSPHATAYSDYFHISPGQSTIGDMSQFRARDEKMNVTYDTGLVANICMEAGKAGLPAGTEGEREPYLDHATFVPLWFINRRYTDYKVVRIGLSGLSSLEHYELGMCIHRAVEATGRRVVFVASGDLSHKLMESGPYGFAEEGPVFDRQITEMFRTGDFLSMLSFDEDFCDKAAECGLRSFQIMAGALDRLAVKPELLSYEGPFGVGYGVAAFTVEGPDDSRDFADQLREGERERLSGAREEEDAYVRLARLSVETYVRDGHRATLPEGLPAEMLETRAGAFVSLKEHGQLRGCIGTISATRDNVAQEILNNAISASTQDPRFPPVRPDELDQLVYSVDVLGDAEPIDSMDQLDPRRYGVIVSRGRRRGLLLPDLEGVDTPAEQVDIARQKAGIASGEKVELERFEVIRHR